MAGRAVAVVRPRNAKKNGCAQNVYRGEVLLLGFYLGFGKEQKRKKGVSWTRLPDDVPTGDDDDEDDGEEEEGKEKDDFQRRRRHARSFVLCELLWCFEGRDAVTPPTTNVTTLR